ncbi:YcgL domain-containing protein [Thalassotalea fonticola]|uniref:YcgL domain-containing protein RI844_06195 n=1 Tax=Thalassotalea fonticola TaxID=3065649 RepID=A0ABZ0GSP7_9GAMM|nr:YcgL domain-containing protein [Colwelliaceae bacterium S1-1]
MLCAVYKSSRKLETYLYVLKRDDFSAVPDALMATFGTPQLVTLINLANRDKLAIADIEKLKTKLSQHGFYLQLPPPTEDLLKKHRIDHGVEDL